MQHEGSKMDKAAPSLSVKSQKDQHVPWRLAVNR